MKKSEFKKLLKPIVKECIRESLLEDGILSSVIVEVTKGLASGPMVEQTRNKKQSTKIEAPPKAHQVQEAMSVNQRLAKHKKGLMSAIGADAYGGVDLFEGTTPAPAQASQMHAPGPLNGTDPNDAGIDISGIMAVGGGKWKSLIG